MARQIFFALSLLVVAVFADNYGSQFGPPAPSVSSIHGDDYIDKAGGASYSEAYMYSLNPGTDDKMRYVGHHVVGSTPYVLAFTPQCFMQTGRGFQTCGIHTYKLTGHQGPSGSYVEETAITLHGSYQWTPPHNAATIKTIDTGAELCWTLLESGGCASDFYNSVWAVDYAGYIYNMFFQNQFAPGAICGENCGCAAGYDVTNGVYHPICTMSAPVDGPQPFGNGYQWVSSGGSSANFPFGQCNVVVLQDFKAIWGAGQAEHNSCQWTPIVIPGSSEDVVSVANAVDSIFLITRSGLIYALFNLHNDVGLTPDSSTVSTTNNISSSWTYNHAPVFIDAWDNDNIRVVAADGTLWSGVASPTSTTFTQVDLPTLLPEVSTCGVFITKESNGAIAFPTNAYLSVGPEAVYFSDAHNDAVSGCAPNCPGGGSPCTQTWDNNWRLYN